jgi:hypothetical protein
LFIPIQPKYLRPPAIVARLMVQLLLLGVSLACLMGFGITLLLIPRRTLFGAAEL